jgi:hypothetical protein
MLGDGHDLVMSTQMGAAVGTSSSCFNGVALAGGRFYRRDERRARNLEINAPAPPTSARTIVGFSGESAQPV